MYLFFLLASVHIMAGIVVSQRVFKPGNRTEQLLVAGLMAYVSFYVVPVCMGWITGFMNGYILATGAAIAIASAFASWFYTRKSYKPVCHWDRGMFKGRSWAEWPVLLAMGAVLLTLLLVGTVLPARFADAAGYHMSNPMSWHRTGQFLLESYGEKELSEQAMSAECAPNVKAVLPFTIMLLTGDMGGTALAQFPFLLLLVVTVRALALRMGTRPALASLAAFGTIVVPEIFLQSVEAYADIVYVTGCFVMVWAIVYLWNEALTWRSIVLPAMGMAIMGGAKATVLVGGAGLGGLVIVLLTWKSIRHAGRRAPVYVLSAGLLMLLMVGLTGGPWFLHAWEKFQNPVYPFKIQWNEKVLFEGRFTSDVNDEMLRILTKTDGWPAYWNTIREVGRPAILSNWQGGLGATFFILGIPALVLFLFRAMWGGPGVSTRRLLTLCAIVLTLVCPTIAIARFSMYQPLLALLALVWLISTFPLIFRAIFSVILALSLLYDLTSTLPSIQYRSRPPEIVAFNLLSGYRYSALIDSFPDQYTALDYWREEISRPGLKLGLHSRKVHPWLTYNPASPADILRYREPYGQHDAEAWHKELMDKGVTHIYQQRQHPGFVVAMKRPDLFRPLVHRLHSQSGKKNEFYIQPWGEDALFELEKGGVR